MPLIISVVLLVLLAATGGWLAHRAQQIRSNLASSMSLLPDLQAAVVARDTDRASAVTDELTEHTTAARSAGTDPLWKAAGLLPFFGQNFSAVSEVTISADDVVTRAVAPMVDKFAALNWNALTPLDGRIDTAPLAGIAPTLSAAATTVDLSYGRLEDIDRSELLPQIAGPLKEAVEALDEARGPINGASQTAELLPPMLGAEGTRNYLVLVQNSAEVRATGGIPGALAVLTVEDGRISLTDQGSATELGRFSPPLEVDPEQEGIYSSRMASFMQSVNLTPDFPTAASTAQQMWQDRHPGSQIDGVIALDPVVLANILFATGPVELGSFGDPAIDSLLAETELPTALDSTNVVPTLLSDVYAQIEEPVLQDAYFAAVAGKVFGALTDVQGDGKQLIDALVTSAGQGRLYVWSASSEEQDLLAQTDLGGAALGPAAGGAAFGVYFNDGTGAKMDYYVRRTVQLVKSCPGDGYSLYTVKVTLTNTAPADAATSLPEYVTGGGAFGVDPGRVRTNTVGYGPAQAVLQRARVDGAEVPVGSFAHGNRPVGILTTELGPGETATLEMDFSKVVQETEPVLDVTPTVQDPADVLLPTEGLQSCG
ncbi:DUF4012 domain-containing protein [Arthrobacter agilis]|uniref:DUF4012 domain-containing protein n=1 Tax=Arthrobacter agilis TaxID=37921 RepID=UPI002780A25B|nr:DUF4012 domain-containing protein [Arthrobacter agilis]MDQ0734040.1 hypothetical protein [Arthrobacter agilis]